MHKRDSYFDISTADAIDTIRRDRNKTRLNKDEDVEFIERLRNNRYVRFGEKDLQFLQRKQLMEQRKVKDKTSQQNPEIVSSGWFYDMSLLNIFLSVTK